MLKLLRNDYLPQKVWPRSYAIDLYHGALLSPKGLRRLDDVGAIQMCERCRRSLTGKSPSQPVDALANFQYYSWSELPSEVRDIF
ncbi:hypothetical protein BKA82DRAFT_142402 [Pisolithus tinctorius]|uniref:Uncharacterized protein n=1 Tax=Pisolithus tinctorius Marx 270 TaxID=870435 RepID=A0A0C3NVM9_PISTI|nr:hypothetical protein BKA82DRAFT_142402 [Pisolithus tinctorius]KIN98402.1 hypothetical protein M404DRAFT_157908 [Pisolithus tinctorius Marx 270]KIO04910.1 hypothetical protein M404DRAFT_142402 [Pisolithus tinctorius Marx 270]